MTTRRHFIASLAALPLGMTAAFSDAPTIYSAAGHAIGGIDPVGYFREGRVVAGSDDYRLMWHNAIWRFATVQNMSMFERNPKRFAPRYGGYCAMSLAVGRIASSTPEAWALRDDRLYLMHSLPDRNLWQADPATHIGAADSHWPAILGHPSSL